MNLSMSSNLKGLVISGPTGVGKTDMSIKLAKLLNSEIISADSSQIYRYMDIGTAKITNEEMQGIRHYLIDIADPGEDYSVGDFEIQVNSILKDKEKNQENIEILDYNEKEFLIKELRKQSSKLGFEISCGNDGMAYGIHYYDENAKTKIVIMTDSFSPKEYAKISKIDKILFFKGNVSIQYENISEGIQNQSIEPLKLKEIPDRILSLACYMAEIL